MAFEVRFSPESAIRSRGSGEAYERKKQRFSSKALWERKRDCASGARVRCFPSRGIAFIRRGSFPPRNDRAAFPETRRRAYDTSAKEKRAARRYCTRGCTFIGARGSFPDADITSRLCHAGIATMRTVCYIDEIALFRASAPANRIRAFIEK